MFSFQLDLETLPLSTDTNFSYKMEPSICEMKVLYNFLSALKLKVYIPYFSPALDQCDMFIFVLIAYSLAILSAAHPSPSCRCMPSDACWPSQEQWASFNDSLGGKLVATAPLALPCHAPNYDATMCQHLKSQWTNPFLQ